MTNNTLRLAVPNKGRLKEPTLALLKKIDLEFNCSERQLCCPAQNFALELLFISASCIPQYVQTGLADLGITGYDLVQEKAAQVTILKKLGYGKTNLTLAVGAESKIKRLSDLNGKRIATSFGRLTKEFLAQQKISAQVIEIEGAVEITPRLGLAEAIADLVSSGETLKLNGLKIMQTILESETVLLSNQALNPAKLALVKSLLLRFDSVLNAKEKKYLTLNAAEELLPKIKKVIPGLTAPTVLRLAQPGMLAVQSVIDSQASWPIIEQLKALGAQDIVLWPIEKIIY
ncbi:MAG: ATP phosphoribosyltransferase [Candidatus Buchananbacteria bacterium]